MGYDPKAIKVKKGDKVISALMFDQNRKRHYVCEVVKATEKNNRFKSPRNKGQSAE
jgi:hypothetical protein